MPEGLPHKVSQIRHDLDDLHELMSQVQQSQSRTESVLHQHGSQIGTLQQSLDVHTVRLDRIDGRLDRVDGRLDQIEDNQHRQFDHLSAQMAEILSTLCGPAAADPPAEPER